MKSTADLYDQYEEKLQIVNLDFNIYGKIKSFQGEIKTVKVFEDNSLVKEVLQSDGTGKVLVVDGGGSKRVALMGDNVASLALKNYWEGVIIYGSIRDSKEINEMDVAIKALGSVPRKSVKRNEGIKDVELRFGSVVWKPGEFVASDEDGIVLLEEAF